MVGVGATYTTLEVVDLPEFVVVQDSHSSVLFLERVVHDGLWLFDKTPEVLESKKISHLGRERVEFQHVVGHLSFTLVFILEPPNRGVFQKYLDYDSRLLLPC